MDLASLSDEELLRKVEALAKAERFSLTDFLIHLGELDQREACQKRGYPSLFAYLTRHLGCAECDAMRRVRAARAAKRFPSILRMIARGELHLVGISLLAPFLNSQNHRRLLNQARRKSKREIEKMTAELAPHTCEPYDRIRALPASSKTAWELISKDEKGQALEGKDRIPVVKLKPGLNGKLALEPGDKTALDFVPIPKPDPLPGLDQSSLADSEPGSLPDPKSGSLSGLEPGPISGPEPDSLPDPEPNCVSGRTKGRWLFTFAGSEEVHQWFRQARDLLRHKFPQGRMEEIIGEALRCLVECKQPKEKKSRGSSRGTTKSRRIPLWVRGQVWRRDRGRCSYVGSTGIRCETTAWLEYDHKVPWALGGRSDDPRNIRLLCRAHNQVEAGRVFGPAP